MRSLKINDPIVYFHVLMDDLSARKNGAPQDVTKEPEARLGAGALARAGDGGGERGIRTPDTLAGTPDFESGAFSRSASSPSHRGAGYARPPYPPRPPPRGPHAPPRRRPLPPPR